MSGRSTLITRALMLGASALACTPPAAALAQSGAQSGAQDGNRSAAPADQTADTDLAEDILVIGGRTVLRGAVMGDVEPEERLNSADIRALGVTSIAEMLTELEPQTNAAGGAPVVLLNGKRISGFQEIRDLPSEAVSRVEILPEQVAITYGYSPNQKVVNIVLRRRFRAYVAEARGGLATDGGAENGQVSASLLRIQGDNRLSVDLKYERDAGLLESERGISPATPARPWSLGGNIAGIASPLNPPGEIDPALSALAGRTVTVAPVPVGAAGAPPTLADFVAGANTASVSDLGRYRSLRPETESFSANATLARALGDVSAALNGTLEISDSDSLQGLPGVQLTLPGANPFSPFAADTYLYRYLDGAGPLSQQVRTVTGHVGLTLNGGLMPGWQWSFTGAGDISETRTRTDRGVSTAPMQALLDAGSASFNPFGPVAADLIATRDVDRARSRRQSLSGDLLVSGTLFDLPAGEASTSLTFSAGADGLSSRSVRRGVPFAADYSRQVFGGQASFDLPLTSRSRDVLGFLGDVGVNVNAGVQHLSDFGTLTTLGYSARWTPIPEIRLLATASQDRAAPSGQQLNDAPVTTPNVAIFDYRRNETVFVTAVSGGNRNLRESVRDQFRLNATIKPFDKTNLTLTANYLNRRTRNPISAFPTPTAQMEAAFPDRFIRDEDGMLLQIDTRPINYLSARSESLRWGVNLSIPLKSARQKAFEAWRAAGSKPEDRPADLRALFGNRRDGERPSGGPERADDNDRQQNDRRNEGMAGPGAARTDGAGDAGGGPGRGERGFGGFRGGGRGGGQGRLQFSLHHTWHLAESIRVAPGVPVIDLLNGGATGSSGGQPRHEIEARAGYTNNGLGARLSVEWESGTRVDGGPSGASTLHFGDLTTVDLRLFANLGQMPKLVAAHPFLRGSRVQINVGNLFNQRRDVHDAAGSTPLRYQPAYLDPVGRSITVSFRKLFF